MESRDKRWGWRWWTLSCLVLGCAVVAGYSWLSSLADPALANFRKIETGMTLVEIKAIAGEPSTTNPVGMWVESDPPSPTDGSFAGQEYDWVAENARLEVVFDSQGFARFVTVYPLEPPTPWEQLCQWLGL